MSPTPSSPAPGADDRATFMNHTLPIGTMVGGLQITGLIGEGGFGIVYLAFDTTLQRQVALKEYMPSSLASRSPGTADISVKSPKFLDTFNAGLRSFVNEARLLAHFDHPSLVKVHQFWQANRTAYMVMPYYQGPTLKAHVATLAAAGRRPDEGMLRGWLNPLLDALSAMHAENCFHRDIAPDNILLTSNGPLLLDFGAARRVISDMTQALTVILKPGYAPIEQYGDVATMTQGPWTDLYALASVVYYCITGHSPITSVERVMGDPLPRLARVAAGQYSSTFLAAIDAALAVRPSDRPQSVAELRALLDGQAQPRVPAEQTAPPPGVPAAPAVPAAYALDQTLLRTSATKGGYAPTMPMTAPHEAAAAPATGAPFATTPPEPTQRVAPTTGSGVGAAVPPSGHGMAAPSGPAAGAQPSFATAGDVPAPRRRGALVAAFAALAGLAIGAGVVMQRGGTGSPPGTDPATRPPTPPTGPAPAAPTPAPAAAGTAVPPPPAARQAQGASGDAANAPPPPVARTPAPAPAKPPPRPPATTERRAESTRAPSPPARAPAPAPAPTSTASERPGGATTYPVPGGSASPTPAAPAPSPAPTAAPPAPAPARSAQAARCAELLKKGSQGTLTIEEATFLRKECR